MYTDGMDHDQPDPLATPADEVAEPAGEPVEPAADAEPLDAPAAPLRPVAELERIPALDVLRGVAVAGILVMNVYAFAMPFAAYTNPLLYGGRGALDQATWIFTHLFFDQKFLSIFSMLFGAGVVLMSRRAKARGRSLTGLFYRRELWLMVIGSVHGYLLWFGDILFHYGLCGMLIYPLRRLSPKKLIVIAVLLQLVVPPINAGMGAFFAELKTKADAAAARAEAGETLSAEDEEAREAWDEMKDFVYPTDEVIREDVEIHRGGYGEILAYRVPVYGMLQAFSTFFFVIWRVGGLMILGMALMKLGILAAARSRRFYRRLVVLGYGLGLPIVAWSAYALHAHDFEPFYFFRIGFSYNYFGAVPVALGHVGVVMLAVKSGVLRSLQTRFAAVGRMALSNYLMHTVLLTPVFYGYGLGLYGHVPRSAQMLFVVAVVALQLVLSPWWLRRHRFGPVEWLWRSLTYWRRQPLRRAETAS